MPEFDFHTRLRPTPEAWFRERTLRPLAQVGNRCVVTCLAMLTGHEDPLAYDRRVNTQDPVGWSALLRQEAGLKLAYCPTDARRLRHYLPELLHHDDLFTLSYYCDDRAVLAEPDDHCWVTGSHIVILHRDRIYDPVGGTVCHASQHPGMWRHTKRIFRAVPADHHRGL